MLIASIDIETTGTDPSWCQTIEVGAVIWDTTDFVTPVKDLPSWHCYVDHPQIRGQAYALALNARILERIAKREKGFTYLTPNQVGSALANFLKANNVDPSSVSPTGFNFDGFDRQFLNRLGGFSRHVHLTHRSLAPATLFFEPMTDAKLINSDEAFRRAGVTVKPEDRHTALGDARAVIEVLRAGFNPPSGNDSPAPPAPDVPRCPECADRQVVWTPEGRGEAEVETILKPCSTCQPAPDLFAPVNN